MPGRSPKVLIQIVTWNSRPYLPACLELIRNQKYTDWSLLIIDNGSRDQTVEFVRKDYPQFSLLENRQNLGFARAHNQGIRISNSEYILVMNPDVILTPSFLSQMAGALQAQPDCGSATGKLLKFNFSTNDLQEPIFTKIIDSTGLGLQRNRRFINRGEGETDANRYDDQRSVFGPSGAVALYRRSALDDVRLKDEFFDEDFFAYKEDIDLAWRLQNAGWRSLYVPEAVAYHHREASRSDTGPALKRERRNRSRFINAYSYKNHLLTLVKNERVTDLLKDFLWISLFELRKLVYIIFYEPKTLSALPVLWRQLPKAFRKRRLIRGRQSNRGLDIRQWFMRT